VVPAFYRRHHRIYLIQDNASYHKKQETYEWFKANRRHVEVLPASALLAGAECNGENLELHAQACDTQSVFEYPQDLCDALFRRLDLLEALFGNAGEARQLAAAALRLSKGRDSEYQAAFALALAGDSAQAQTLANDLATRFPEDTVVQYNCLPTIRAQLALKRSDFAKAMEALQVAAPYELGGSGVHNIIGLHPVYVARTKGAKPLLNFRKTSTTAGL